MNELTTLIEPVDTMYEFGKWIPCSERLPEHDEDVLITDEYGDVSIASIEFFERLPDPWQWADENGYLICYKVLAWMPLPMPYKEKTDE